MFVYECKKVHPFYTSSTWDHDDDVDRDQQVCEWMSGGTIRIAGYCKHIEYVTFESADR